MRKTKRIVSYLSYKRGKLDTDTVQKARYCTDDAATYKGQPYAT